MEPRTDFAEFCERLNAHHVEFVIVGAHALAFHGAPRFTGDLDIYVAPTLHNGRRVVDAIADFGFPVDALSAEGVIDPRRVIEMGIPPIQIHVMSAIDGVTWAEVLQGAVSGHFDGVPVSFIGREAFLKNKRAAGRPKDIADVAALVDDDSR